MFKCCKSKDTQKKFRLSADQIYQFERDGFAVMRGFVDLEEVQRMRQLLEHLFERFNDLPKALAYDLSEHPHLLHRPRNPEIARCLRLEPRLAKTDYLQNIKLMARQLLRPEARLCFDHAILKPPHNNCPTLWHQDAAYEKPGGSERRLSFWLPLQNVSVESGCLQFIRGSNSGDLLPHHPIAIGSHALTAHVEPLEAVPCPIKAGDFTLHSGRTLHYAGPNVTDQPRLAWVLVFAVGGSSPRARMMRLAAPILTVRRR